MDTKRWRDRHPSFDEDSSSPEKSWFFKDSDFSEEDEGNGAKDELPRPTYSSTTNTLDIGAASSVTGRLSPFIQRAIRRSLDLLADESEDENFDHSSESEDDKARDMFESMSRSSKGERVIINESCVSEDDTARDMFESTSRSSKGERVIIKKSSVSEDDTARDMFESMSTSSKGERVIINESSVSEDDTARDMFESTSRSSKGERVIIKESSVSEDDTARDMFESTSRSSKGERVIIKKSSVSEDDTARDMFESMSTSSKGERVIINESSVSEYDTARDMFESTSRSSKGERVIIKESSVSEDDTARDMFESTSRSSKEERVIINESSVSEDDTTRDMFESTLRSSKGERVIKQSLTPLTTLEKLEDVHRLLATQTLENEKAKAPRGQTIDVLPHQHVTINDSSEYKDETCINISGNITINSIVSLGAEEHPLYAKPTNKKSNKMAKNRRYFEQTSMAEELEDLQRTLAARPADNEKAKDPPGLNIPLMAHQQYALTWLRWREKEKPRGGILADEGGLGKTLTMIAHIMASIEKSDGEEQIDREDNVQSSARNQEHLGGTLVITEKSTMAHWMREVQQRCHDGILTIWQYYDRKRVTVPEKLARNDIVITSYKTLKVAFQTKDLLYNIRWRRVILDDAHIIKNHSSQTCKSVCALETNTRWALTGAPIQNKEMDLYAILKFLRCSPFDDIQVWKRWVGRKVAASSERLVIVVKTLMLRRTKEELRSNGKLGAFTEKTIEFINVNLDPEERQVYDELLVDGKMLFKQLLAQKAEKCNEVSSTVTHQDMHTDVKLPHIIVLLMRLRQICCHPTLISSMSNAVKAENSVFDPKRQSSKVRMVLKKVKEILNVGEKLIIVSEWSQMLDILRNDLRLVEGASVDVFTGYMSVKDRQSILDDFNSPDGKVNVLLLSPRAGGMGLNIVGANHLLFTEILWNPQLDNQVQERIYHCSQEKNVHIYKFICVDTIEEMIKALQKKKLELANAILTPDVAGSTLSLDDMKLLFGL